MAKRFTDSEKWKDEWWGSLPNDYRMIWLYLVDSCSIAGIWKKDFRGLQFNCNVKISESEFLAVFGTRLIDMGNFFFIPKFLLFQCPKGLNSNKPAILSIVKELTNNNLIEIIQQSLPNDFLIIKGKGKGKGKGEDKGEDKGEGDGKDIEIVQQSLPNDSLIICGDYIEVDFLEITDPLPILLQFNAQLNGTQKENSNKAWRPLVEGWFKEHIGESFQDANHVKNSFKKYYYSKLKPNGNRTNFKGSSISEFSGDYSEKI